MASLYDEPQKNTPFLYRFGRWVEKKPEQIKQIAPAAARFTPGLSMIPESIQYIEGITSLAGNIPEIYTKRKEALNKGIEQIEAGYYGVPWQQSQLSNIYPTAVQNQSIWQSTIPNTTLPAVSTRTLIDYEAREATKENLPPPSVARPEEPAVTQTTSPKKPVEARMNAMPAMEGLYLTPESYEGWLNKTIPSVISRKSNEKNALAEMKYYDAWGNPLNIAHRAMAEQVANEDMFLDELNKAYQRGVGLNLIGVASQLPAMIQRPPVVPEIEYGTFTAPRFQTMGAALKRGAEADIEKQLATTRKLSREMGRPEVSLAANVQAQEAMLKTNIAALTADTEIINKSLEAAANASNMGEQSRVEAARLRQQYQLAMDQGTREQQMQALSNIQEYLTRISNLGSEKATNLLAYEKEKKEQQMRQILYNNLNFKSNFSLNPFKTE